VTPQAGFGGVEVYPDIHVKAAVLALAFARAQRCPDGNKRLSLILLVTFLALNGFWVSAEQHEFAKAILRGATEVNDDIARRDLATWIEAHIVCAQ
jgi:death on curing protein